MESLICSSYRMKSDEPFVDDWKSLKNSPASVHFVIKNCCVKCRRVCKSSSRAVVGLLRFMFLRVCARCTHNTVGKKKKKKRRNICAWPWMCCRPQWGNSRWIVLRPASALGDDRSLFIPRCTCALHSTRKWCIFHQDHSNSPYPYPGLLIAKHTLECQTHLSPPDPYLRSLSLSLSSPNHSSKCYHFISGLGK